MKDDVQILKIALFVLSNGGEVTKQSCYDEEGVDCWKWEFEGKEWIELGIHEELPTIPDEMVKYVLSKPRLNQYIL